MPTDPPSPSGSGSSLRGDRALAVRLIGETGARAARRPFAATVHPPSRAPLPKVGIDRVPKDLVRRVFRRLDRLVVRHAGRVLLALRRVDDDEVVRQLHASDHRCFELEQQLIAGEPSDADEGH